MNQERRLPPYKILLALSLVWILGIFAHAFFESSWLSLSSWFTVVSLSFCLVVLAFRYSVRLRIPAVLLLVLAVSFARYELELRRVPAWVDPPTGTETFIGTVREVRGDGVSLIVNGVAVRDGPSINFGVLLTGDLPLVALPGDEISWQGRASPLLGTASELPQLRLGRAGWFCRINRVTVVRQGKISPQRMLAMMRRSMRSLVFGMIPPTEASLLMGLLAGERSELPASLSSAFRDTGTTHLLAVSGYNIAQVTGAVLVAFASLKVKRRRAIVWSVLAVVAFTLFVGCGASVVRAAFMGGLALGAARLERKYDSGIGLAVAASVMLFISPFSLRHDLGFQLSFAAVLGLRYFGPPIAAQLTKIIPAAVAVSLSDSLAAVMATLPIIIYNFGIVTPVAPLTNLLVAPLVPFAMLAGVGAAFFSFFLPVLAPLFGLVPWVLLKTITTAVTWTAVVPTLAVQISPLEFASLSLFLVALAFRWRSCGRLTRRFL